MIKTKTGWIKLPREILYDEIIFKSSEYLAVYLYLLLCASYENSKVLVGGREIALSKGEAVVSVREIAGQCKIEPTKVYRILKNLEKCNKIATKSKTENKTGKTIVSIGLSDSLRTENTRENEEKYGSFKENKDEKEKRSKREKEERKEEIKNKEYKKYANAKGKQNGYEWKNEMSTFDTDDFFQAALARSAEHIRKRAKGEIKIT